MLLNCSSLVTWETSVNITLKLLPAFTKIYECPETIMLLSKNENALSLPFCSKEELSMGFLQTLFVSKTDFRQNHFALSSSFYSI